MGERRGGVRAEGGGTERRIGMEEVVEGLEMRSGGFGDAESFAVGTRIFCIFSGLVAAAIATASQEVKRG